MFSIRHIKGHAKNLSAVFSLLPMFAYAGQDISPREIEAHAYVKIVDKDPKGVNCRFTPAGQVAHALPASDSELYLAYEKLAYVDGKPWAFLRIDASGCFVRANTDFIQVQKDNLDYRETIFEGGGIVRWLVTDTASPLNCRKDLTTNFNHVVATLPRGSYITDFNYRDYADHGWVIEGVDYHPADKKPWFAVKNLDSKILCYVRANSDYLRMSGEVP